MCALMVRDDLSSLPFTTMCIRESLRLHAPVQAVTRRYIQDMKLPGGHAVPKGKRCFVWMRLKRRFSIITGVKCWIELVELPVLLLWIWCPRLNIRFMCIYQLFGRKASKITPASISIFSLQISALK